MKKLLSLLLLSAAIGFGTSIPAQATENTATTVRQQQQNFAKQRTNKDQMKKQFEERLNLTDKQKEKAKKIHEQGRIEMEPIMKKIEAKRNEMYNLKQLKIDDGEKEVQMALIRTDLKELEKKAKELRKKNSEDFEKILNKTQKAELDRMKAEGRAKFEKEHKARPPFQGLGSPNLFIKPVMPKPTPVTE